MDLPQPPADVELKNIIDKLAQFVARNGPEFEQMTKNKQKDNPKFSFLFGGELFNYYQYKVTTEQAILKVRSAVHTSKSSQPQNSQAGVLGGQINLGQNSPNNSSNALTPMQIMNAAAANSNQWLMSQQQLVVNPSLSLPAILEQQNVLQQQITQSEQNLGAQHAALMQSQDSLIQETIRKFNSEKLSQRAIEAGIDLNELNNVLQPIIDSCTKDSISSGKAWILNHTSKGAHDVISEYLLQKVINPGVLFIQKLHIIYLINDVMHHCVRKNADILKKSLENVVVPMFCHSWMCGSTDQQGKLNKLLNLWEAKNNYFTAETIKSMKSPENSWERYKSDVLKANEDIIAPIQLSTKTTYESYRAQHQIFVNHALVQIQNLETQKMQVEQQQQQQQQETQNQILQLQNLPMGLPPILSNDDVRPMSFDTPPPNVLPPPGAPPGFTQPPPILFSHLPPELVPDFSKPPPGFQPPEPCADDLVPSVPYYELPAGLVVPLIRTDDFNYKPLDPRKLRLPPAVPPSERLMQAVEAFYQKSYTGIPRERLILDADGWEKLGLYEYYKAKNAARKKKELEIEAGLRDKSRSPSPIRREKSRSRSPKKKRCYKSKSPSPVPKSRSKSRSRSPAPPPTPRHQHRNSNGRKSPRRASRNSRRSRSKSKSKSPSPPPARARSPTPPSFLGGAYGAPMEEMLDESNKGHQMLRKMGWSGAGLGSKEQGIAAPISGGEVRDRVDQYKGVGVSLHDPYENFRKNKGKAFITRMKARAEERTTT